MRWEELFADLEAQLAAAEAADHDAEVRDRTRREQALLTWHDRLVPAVGQQVAMGCASGLTVRGRLLDVGVDWLLLEQERGREALVPASSLLTLSGVTRWSQTPEAESEVVRRLDLRWALRGITRDRSAVQVRLLDGRTLHGTLDRVGADHVDLAEHPPDEPRRARDVRQVTVVALSAVVAVVRATD